MMTAAEEHTTSQEPQYSSQPDRLRAYTAADDNCAGRGHLAPNSSVGSTGREANSHRETNSTSLKDICARMEKVKDQAGGSVADPDFFGQSEGRKRKAVRAPRGGGWRGAHGRRRLEMLKGRIVCGGTHSGG